MKKIFAVCLMAIAASVVMAGAAFASDVVGIVDFDRAMVQHPKMAQVQKQLKEFGAAKEKEAQAAIDKEKDNNKKGQIFQAKRMEVLQEQEKLMGPLLKDVDLAIRTVAAQKKITVVLDTKVVFFGGKEITDAVITELKKK